VLVAVLVGVPVGVSVGVLVAVLVGVPVGVSVGVLVAVLVGVSVDVLVGVLVGVSDGAWALTGTVWGEVNKAMAAAARNKATTNHRQYRRTRGFIGMTPSRQNWFAT